MIAKYQIDADDLVGFTSMFSQNVPSFAMAEKLKERNPNIVTVIGGANCEAPMSREIARQVNSIDFVFSGPALKSFVEFIGYRLRNEEQNCHRIRGVLSRKNYLLSVVEGANAIGEELDIDTEIELDYEPFLATLEKNFPDGQVAPTLLFETSRGCWWGERAHCTFCGLNGTTMKYRAMNPSQALDLFQRLFRYGSRCSRWESVDNIMPKEYLTDVFPYLDPPRKSTIFYEVKADLKQEDLAVLSKASVTEIQPGIESLATSTLKLMKKGTTAFQNIVFLKNCLTYGISPVWNLLIGFPGETEEVYRKYLNDLPLLIHLPPPSGVYPVRFDRYSPYFVQAEQYGLDLQPCSFYEFIYPFDRNSLANLAYYFVDQNYSASYLMTMIEWSDRIRKEVDSWRAAWDRSGQEVKPKLFFEAAESSTVICDTRSGETLRHDLGETSIKLLQFLAERKRLDEIESALTRVPDFDVRQELSLLSERGLVFEERGRYLSLVLAEDSGAFASTTDE